MAARKAARLLDCGAKVIVVSPGLADELASLKKQNLIEHIDDDYAAEYLYGACLVIGATDDEKINERVSHDAKSRGILVNIADDPQKCDFILPSVVERGDLTIACGTGGSSPALARYLREELEKTYTQEYGVLTDILGQLRAGMEKNTQTGRRWFDELMAAGLLDAIRQADESRVKEIVRSITGREVSLERN